MACGGKYDTTFSWNEPFVFVADDDLTLRQVICVPRSTVAAIISTDPDFSPVKGGQTENKFQLIFDFRDTNFTGVQRFSVGDLAFPIQKGSRLYYSFDQGSIGEGFFTLIFS